MPVLSDGTSSWWCQKSVFLTVFWRCCTSVRTLPDQFNLADISHVSVQPTSAWNCWHRIAFSLFWAPGVFQFLKMIRSKSAPSYRTVLCPFWWSFIWCQAPSDLRTKFLLLLSFEITYPCLMKRYIECGSVIIDCWWSTDLGVPYCLSRRNPRSICHVSRIYHCHAFLFSSCCGCMYDSML